MKKIIIRSVCFIIIVLLAGILFFYFHALHYSNDSLRRNDVAALEEEEYALLLLPMYSEDSLSVYPYEYYLAYKTYKPEHDFKKLTDVADYLEKALVACGNLQEVYIFFDPAMVNRAFFNSSSMTQKAYQKLLYENIVANPQVLFKFMLPAYSMEYWCDQPDSEVAEALESYVLFCNEFSSLSNVKIYYFGHLDWVIGNSGNYADPESCTEEVNNRLVTLTMANDNYQVNGELLAGDVAELADGIEREKSAPRSYDMSDYKIVFFGDSIIGNYSGSLSVPGVVKGLTGAGTYNCAVGGQTASTAEGEETAAFDKTLNYFLAGAGQEAFAEKEQFCSEVERFKQDEHENAKLCFVVEYGLNDYFAGRAVSNPEDARDITTYTGALRVGVERIREAYPDADIVLLTPTLSAAFEKGTVVMSEMGAPLAEYVNAVIALGEELKVPVVNNYRDLGVEDENWLGYLEDQTHYNEWGRFELAEHLVDFLATELGYSGQR